MKPLRLCYIGPAASVTLRRWVEWFAARGHDTTIITVEPAESEAIGKFQQIDVGGCFGPRKLRRVISATRMAIAVNRLKPDVVHAHYLRGLAWGLLLKKGIPCVVTPWGSDILEEQGAFREWYSKGLTRTLIGAADLVTVHSDYIDEQVKRLAPTAGPVVRIGRGVDLQRFRPGLDVRELRARWRIGENNQVIFSPRLATPFYNHDRVINALPSVRGKFPHVVLIIAEQWADPGYVAGLRRLASGLGVMDHVRFVEAIPYPDMPLWYNLADLVVMVPRSDGMPNSLLEAMACGTVPVLGRLPQYTELIHQGVNGFLVGPGEGDLAEALIGVLSDLGLREQIAHNNRARALEIADQGKEMSKMETWYHKLSGVTNGR